MKKRLLAALLASAAVLSFAGCKNDTSSTPDSSTPDSNAPANTDEPAGPVESASDEVKTAGTGIKLSDTEGKVFNIYCWNEEFKGFFEKYYVVPEGVTVNWVINPSDGGVYQQKLDEALLAQSGAAADAKIDMFLAEADYIQKYVDSDYTKDIASIGVKQLDTEYQYTVNACTDTRNGAIKGVSFQCCPSGLIYRRSIAKEVLGTDDPAAVQDALSDWTKFEEVAKKAKDMGYYMTASFAETFRTFSNNATSAWVDADNNLVIDSAIQAWMDQTEKFMKEGYTTDYALWSDEKNAQMLDTGKTMCFFGPAWYYNFSMGNAMETCPGDWGIVEGPQAHFWGGTWLLAAEGTDNPEMVADVMNAFTANEDICYKLIANEGQFTNNSAVNEKYAAEGKGNAFLNGQNDTALFLDLCKNIKWENHTIYDQILNENIQTYMLEYFKGNVTKEQALGNFYASINEAYPDIVTP